MYILKQLVKDNYIFFFCDITCLFVLKQWVLVWFPYYSQASLPAAFEPEQKCFFEIHPVPCSKVGMQKAQYSFNLPFGKQSKAPNCLVTCSTVLLTQWVAFINQWSDSLNVYFSYPVGKTTMSLHLSNSSPVSRRYPWVQIPWSHELLWMALRS